MTRRQRLLASLRGQPVDRPAVSFYEIGGFIVDPADPDPFNVYNHPSWRPLLELAEEQTDLLRLCYPVARPAPGNRHSEFFGVAEYIQDGSRFIRTTVRAGGRVLTSLTRRDPNVNTIWTLEHLLKDGDDVAAYLRLPDEVFADVPDVSAILEEDRRLGERGIIMIDTADPIGLAAGLFSMEHYTVIALTEPALFHRLLEKESRHLLAWTEQVGAALPGRLWRICGPEYATPPFLPPRLFEEYVVRYTGPLVAAIRRHGGMARLHCHGNIRQALPHFVAMGCAATDPIEPPPQGDITLAEVRRQFAKDLTLFGNLEIADIENLEPSRFEKVVRQTVAEGTAGAGRGFVLMPSAAPYGRQISATTMANYQTMVRVVHGG